MTEEIIGTPQEAPQADPPKSILHRKRSVRRRKPIVKKVQVQQEAPVARRTTRIPFGRPEQRLSSPGDPKFQYRVFNDNWSREPGRVERALNAGYEKVAGYPEISVGTNEDGTAIKGILMQIPIEFYEEDQKAKQKEVNRIDEEIHRGQLDTKPQDKRYIPSSGIHIETKLTP